MPSVFLPVSVLELQSESDAKPISTGLCSSSTLISFTQYTCSTHKICSAHFKVVQMDPRRSRLSGFSSFVFSRFINHSMVRLLTPVIVEARSLAWCSDVFSPTYFFCLLKLWRLRILSLASVLHRHSIVFVVPWFDLQMN